MGGGGVRLTAVAIRFRTSVLVLTVLLVVGGTWSYVTLPKEATPAIDFPILTITTLYPGASPPEVEALVTFPIEQEFQGMEGLAELRSVSREGVSAVVAEFGTDVDRADARRRVREALELARAELPAEAEEPRLLEIDFEEIPVITVNLLAAYPLATLKRVAEGLQEEIEGIPGVREAELTGGVEREVQVNVDAVALHAAGLTFEDVATAIEAENVSLPGGTITTHRLGYQVRVDGRLEDGARIADLMVAAPGGRPVYVGDVAEVVGDGYGETQSVARLRVVTGERAAGPGAGAGSQYRDAISLAVRARAGENIIETVRGVERVVASYALPPGTEVVLTGDRSETVVEFVEELENHIVFGVLLVTLSLLFFLGLRTALLAALAIPLTLLLTFALFRAAGETLNFIVLFSLIIVLGILVDFAIIVVENVHRRREQGASAWAAVEEATAEVAWPVTAGLATSAAVFVPLLFWGGITGEFLRWIPITLIATLASALFVALVIIPVLAGYAYGAGEGGGGLTPLARRLLVGTLGFAALVLLLASPATVVVLALATAVAVPLYRRLLRPASDRFRHHWLPAAEGRYREFLGWSLQRDHGAKHALLRNAAPFAAFTAGALLLVAGGAIALLLGRLAALAALPALVPGGLLLAAGALAILALFVETLLLAGRLAVKAGLILGGLFLLAGLVQLLRGAAGPAVLLVLMALPLLLVVAGLVGERRFAGRRHLVLTDNRARVLALALGSVLVTILLFGAAPTGTAFFPETDPNQVVVTVEAPVGTRLEEADRVTQRAVRRMEALLERDPAVRANIRNIVVNVGVGGDAGGALLRAEPDPRRGQVTLNMVDFAHRAESSARTLEKLREALTPFPGATLRFDQDRPGPPGEPPLQIRIAGPDYGGVADIAAGVEARLREAVLAGRLPELVDLRSDLQQGQPEVRVRVDRDRAALFGVSTRAVATTVRAVEGRIAGTIREGQDEFDIRVRLREEDRATLEGLELLQVGGGGAGAGAAAGRGGAGSGAGVGGGRAAEPDAGAGGMAAGGQIPLLAVAELEIGSGAGAINRRELQPVVTIEADGAPGVSSRAVVDAARRELAGVAASLPPGYTMRYAGEVEEQQEEFAFLGMALVFGLGLILLVLVTKFNSLGLPFMILIAIGLTMTGVILGLMATRTAFSLFTFLGVISLAGIVADDDIVLTEFMEKEREAGRGREDAIVAGASSRFRQVTLTAVTTIVGLIPLTFGLNVDFRGLLTDLSPGLQLGGQNTQFWGPLGGAIIAGLPAATAVTLLVVPVIYSVFDSVRRKAGEALRGDRRGG
jgi:multidrug efflux pump